MKPTKPPVLTSPWKIGFFVSLMLVVVGSGVAYFFLRQMEIAWNFPEWGNWNGWLDMVTHPEGPIVEMWPLLAIVGLTSLLSYIVITQAVRKYKGYLDSGLDYKHLLASIREIDDLEDRSRVDRLMKNHPELKNFLLNARSTVADKVRELDELEADLQRLTKNSVAEVEAQMEERFGVQCNRLVSAIQGATNSFPELMDVTTPELKRVEEAIRKALTGRMDRADHDAAITQLKAANDAARKEVESVAQEIQDGIKTVREIESSLGEVTSAPAPKINTESTRQDLEKLTASFKEIEQLSARLDGIGDEAKGIAINTALKAGSGKGTQADLIQLAEDVKEVAAKFSDVAKSYADLTTTMSGSVTSIGANLNQLPGAADAGSSPSLEPLAAKMSRWLERGMVLSEKVKQLGASLVQAAAEEKAQPAGREQPQFETDDYGFETMGKSPPLFSKEKQVGEVPAIEREEGLFSDAPSESDMFAELADTTPHEEGQPETGQGEVRRGQVDMLEPRPPALEPESPSARASGSPARTKGRTTGASELVLEPSLPSARKGEPDVKDHVIDLYDLGAVDYDPAIHS